MNILLYTDSSSYTSAPVGGAQTSIRLIGEKLAQRGHNIVYITEAEDGVTEVSRQQIDGVTVYFYPKKNKQTLTRRLLGKNAKKFKDKQIQKLLATITSEHKIELVYIHYHLAIMERILAVRETFGYKVIMRMAGLIWFEDSIVDEKRKARYETAFMKVDSINYNTPGLKDLTYEHAKKINFSYRPQDEFVADIGAFTKQNTTFSAPKNNHDCLNMVVATRFSTYQKRQDILVEAVNLLDRDLKIKVTMIGSGPEKKNIEKLIQEYDLQEKFELIPFLSQKDLWEFLATQDVLCHPCEYEGLSKIIIESMMLGLPVLASKVLPLGDYLEHDRTGFLVPNTAKAWAKEITRLYHSKEVLSSAAIKGQEYALNAFDSEKNVAAYERNFERLLSGG